MTDQLIEINNKNFTNYYWGYLINIKHSDNGSILVSKVLCKGLYLFN